MNIKPIHPDFQLPQRNSAGAGGYDLYMPFAGKVSEGQDGKIKVPLGFAAEVPEGYVALILPRSGVGSKAGLELNNTCGVIDSDYRGEWIATIRTKNGEEYGWAAGERLLQFILVPVHCPELQVVTDLSDTARGTGGLGSSGK